MAHTAEQERLLALMAELTSRKEYATGLEPFPRPLAVADARTIAADIQQTMDLAAEKRAEVAAAQGHPVACRAGCAACCDQLVMIWAAEAELVAEWLDRPENAAIREAFVARYPAWREASAGAIAQVGELTAKGDHKGQYAALMDHWSRKIPCAFLAPDGRCSIYPVRPSVCRNAHALDTAEWCHPADSEGPAAISLHFQPLEDFIRKARVLSMAMHNALGRPARQLEPLPSAVHDRLRRPVPPPG